jgi:hypothetical protein
MTFKVYHDRQPTFGFGPTKDFNDETFELVAEVECDHHADTFRLTNHIEHDWTTNPEVKALKTQVRSTSVGDVVVAEDGTRYLCKGAGWEVF